MPRRAARGRWLHKGRGAVFGALLWLCADEIPISFSGVSNPFKKSAVSHGSALAAHLLFGITVATLFGHGNTELMKTEQECDRSPTAAGRDTNP